MKLSDFIKKCQALQADLATTDTPDPQVLYWSDYVLQYEESTPEIYEECNILVKPVDGKFVRIG
jgi:hypothetical protein